MSLGNKTIYILLATFFSIFFFPTATYADCVCERTTLGFTQDYNNTAINNSLICNNTPNCRWEQSAAQSSGSNGSSNNTAAAQNDGSLQFDQRCFTEDQCKQQREELEFDGDGFVETPLSKLSCTGFAQMNSGQKTGFCSAGNEISTEVTFGGRTQFGDIADFIAFIFQFSFGIAVVLAVIMILVAGIQWMSSAGNSSVIGDAKKRIGGAILGLFLLAMSYTILDVINPALVSFRPLEIYMINPIETAPEFCSDLGNASSTPLFLAAANGDTNLTPLDTAVRDDSTAVGEATCGDQYYIANAGGQTCRGRFCDTPGYTCVPFTINSGGAVTEGVYDCFDGRFMIHLKSGAFMQSIMAQWNVGGFASRVIGGRRVETNWITNSGFRIMPICKTEGEENYYMPKSNFTRTNNPYQFLSINSHNGIQLSGVQMYEVPNEPLRDYYIHLPDNTFSQIVSQCENDDPTTGLIIKINVGTDWRMDKDIFLGKNGILATDPQEMLENKSFMPTTAFTTQRGGNPSNFFYRYDFTDNHVENMTKKFCFTTQVDNTWTTICDNTM